MSHEKYIKYKQKYLNLSGGTGAEDIKIIEPQRLLYLLEKKDEKIAFVNSIADINAGIFK